MILFSPNHHGAYNYKNMISIGLDSQGITIKPAWPFMKEVQIPMSAIEGCSKTCFDRSRWDVDVLVAKPPVEVSFTNTPEVIEWCWANKLRVVSTSERTEWMYKSKPLLSKKHEADQIRTRVAYDEALRRACLGY